MTDALLSAARHRVSCISSQGLVIVFWLLCYCISYKSYRSLFLVPSLDGLERKNRYAPAMHEKPKQKVYGSCQQHSKPYLSPVPSGYKRTCYSKHQDKKCSSNQHKPQSTLFFMIKLKYFFHFYPHLIIFSSLSISVILVFNP